MDPVILTSFVLVVGIIFTVMFVFRSRRQNIDQIVENIEPKVYEPLPEREFYKGTLSTERVPPRESAVPTTSPLRNYKTKKANLVDAARAEANTSYSSTTSSMDGLLVGAVAGAILTQPSYSGPVVDTAPTSEPVSTYSPPSADTSLSYDSNPSGSYDSGSSSSYDSSSSSSSSNSDSGGGGW